MWPCFVFWILLILKFLYSYIAKTLYGDEEEEEDANPKNKIVHEPKLLGLHPGSNEKVRKFCLPTVMVIFNFCFVNYVLNNLFQVLLKSGPYGVYIQLGENRTGYLPKRASASHVRFPSTYTLKVF